jgi:trk system potassium uptake protein TrkA
LKIIILGAGQVGATLAENLASEANDITVVDTDRFRLRALQDRLDIRTIHGNASYPDVLRQAGGVDADMLIAVTNSDEINMVACQISHALFRTPTKIARVRSPAYDGADNSKSNPLFGGKTAFNIDQIIRPEQLVTEAIFRLIQQPGALQVMDFAGGLVQLVAVRAYSDGALVGRELKDLRKDLPKVDTRVAAIFRKDRPIIPRGDTVIEADDEVFFLAARKDIRAVVSELQKLEKPYRRILIAGGGNIGARLATSIENQYRVKLIERGQVRCKELSELLNKTVVLQGDASDQDLLLEERIDDVDVFCAVTNSDEANIMSSMLAKKLGARKVMTLINNAAYVDLVQGGLVDIAVSPEQATIGSLLQLVRRGSIQAAHSLRRGAAEAIEAVAHGDARSSRIVGRPISEISLPSGATIGAVVREDEVLIAHDHIKIEHQDHVIMFLTDKRKITDIERLFSVAPTFL